MELPSPPLFGRQPFRHEIRGPEGALWADDVLHDWNTQSSSQWDGFRHIRNHDSGFYGGLPGYEHGVHHWARRGIAGRAVVADVGRWRASIGRPLIYDAPDPIDGTEVIATLAAQDVEIQEDDVLLLRTGWIAGTNHSRSNSARPSQGRLVRRRLVSGPVPKWPSSSGICTSRPWRPTTQWWRSCRPARSSHPSNARLFETILLACTRCSPTPGSCRCSVYRSGRCGISTTVRVSSSIS